MMFTLNFEQILTMLFVTNEETSDTTNVLFVQKVFTANLLKNM